MRQSDDFARSNFWTKKRESMDKYVQDGFSPIFFYFSKDFPIFFFSGYPVPLPSGALYVTIPNFWSVVATFCNFHPAHHNSVNPNMAYNKQMSLSFVFKDKVESFGLPLYLSNNICERLQLRVPPKANWNIGLWRLTSKGTRAAQIKNSA